MGRTLNKVLLIGRLGKDPEIRYTQSGTAVANFSLATNETWKDADGTQQERTDWHNIVAWQRLAEVCHQYLKKGSQVYIEGRIQTRSYEDKNNPGAKKYITEIVASQLIMLGSGQSTGTQSEQAVAPQVEQPALGPDDLPF